MPDTLSLAEGLRSLLRGEDMPEANRRRLLTAAAWELELSADTVAVLDEENARLRAENDRLRTLLAEAAQHEQKTPLVGQPEGPSQRME